MRGILKNISSMTNKNYKTTSQSGHVAAAQFQWRSWPCPCHFHHQPKMSEMHSPEDAVFLKCQGHSYVVSFDFKLVPDVRVLGVRATRFL